MRVYIVQTVKKNERAGQGPKILRGGNLTTSYLAGLCPDYCEVKLCDESYQEIDYSYDADIVALTAVTCTANRAYEIAERFKRDKGSWTVLGGCHATVLPDEALQHVDSVCVGEGDYTFPKLVDSVRRTGKAEREYRNDGPIDLRNLPHPKRHLLDPSGIYLHGVQMTRGCHYMCDFCFIRKLYGPGVRVRPVDDVVKEIAETIDWDKFAFWDDNIIANREHAYELFTKLIPLEKQWISQCCLEIADHDALLKQAVRSGCKALFIGIESFDQQSLRAMKKGFNKARTYKERIAKLHDHGIFVDCGINFGSDEDDPFVFERSLEAIDYVGIDAASVTICTPMPGTDLRKRLLADGRIFDFEWDHYDYRHVVFKPKNMTEEQLAEGHGWFYNQFYSLRRIGKRLFENSASLSMPLGYQILINRGYRRTARKTSRRGHNPASTLVGRPGPQQTMKSDEKYWSDHDRLVGQSR